ncbi:MAG: hypothetical protein Kow0042_14990 [Calditrichia bacterium]
MKNRLIKISILFTLMALCSGYAYPGKVVRDIPAPGKFASGLTFDGKNLWVADYQADKLFCVDPVSGKIIRQIPSPGFWPMGLAWDGNNLWNIDAKLKKIFKVDPVTGKILATIDSPSDNPDGLTWDGHTLWVSDHREKSIMKIDLSDGTAVHSFPAPAKYPQGLAFDGQYLWCSDRLQDEIYMIDHQSGEVILVCEAPGPYSRGITWDGEYLWNVDYQTDKIYQLVHWDNELYKLSNQRNSRITFTHQTKIWGEGLLHNLEVYIAIPEDLPQQRILTKTFIPSQYNPVKDRWAQPFAAFIKKDVSANATIQYQMVIEAEISEISYFILPHKCGSLKDIPADIKKLYTADGSKYQISDPYIQDIVRKVVGNEQNPYWIARKIFDYVRNNLEYKLEGGWNVAPVVLKRGTGSCSEYTFSFIALCRAAGLPARYVGSIVVRGDDSSLDEVFHRWPEVYLPNYGWVSIDPQGGDKELPRDRAMNISHLSNRFLITTRGGGDSEYLGWYYNSYEKYSLDPQIQINIETFGEWEPLETE